MQSKHEEKCETCKLSWITACSMDKRLMYSTYNQQYVNQLPILEMRGLNIYTQTYIHTYTTNLIVYFIYLHKRTLTIWIKNILGIRSRIKLPSSHLNQ